jgi:hypothetical protein
MILFILAAIAAIGVTALIMAGANWVTANYMMAEYHIFSTINHLRRTHDLPPLSCAHHIVTVQKTAIMPCDLHAITPSAVAAAYGDIIFDPSVHRISVDMDITVLRFLLFRKCVVTVGASQTP